MNVREIASGLVVWDVASRHRKLSAVVFASAFTLRAVKACRPIISWWRDVLVLLVVAWVVAGGWQSSDPVTLVLVGPWVSGWQLPDSEWTYSLTVAALAVGYVLFAGGLLEAEAEHRQVMRAAATWRWKSTRNWPIRYRAGRTPWAITRDGAVLDVPTGTNILVGGLPGSGKSVAVNGLIYGHADNPHIHYVLIDLKGGVEMIWWKSRADYVATNAPQALAALQACRQWLAGERLPAMISDDDNLVKDVGPPSAEWPHLVIVVDELAALMRHPEFRKELISLLSEIVQGGRAAGVWMVDCTQSPMASIVPTEFRDNHHITVCGATLTQSMADVIAGQGAFSAERVKRKGLKSVPWDWNVDKPEYLDSGRFILNGNREVRFVYRTDEEIRVKDRETGHLSDPPLIRVVDVDESVTLDDRPEPPAVPLEVPHRRMTWDQLADQLEARTGRRPARQGQGPRTKPSRQEMFDAIVELDQQEAA